MLMQNFKSAADLEITEQQKDALAKTLVLLETAKLEHIPDRNDLDVDFDAEAEFSGKFNMNSWSHTYKKCGTVCCIGGTAELIGGVDFEDATKHGTPLYNLFYPDAGDDLDWDRITIAQAAAALRSYLTTGDARWDLALAPSRT
jgi:hypothetical protein